MIGPLGRRIGELGHVRNRDIAMVGHLETEAAQHSQETGGTKRRRPHQGAALGCAHVDGCTDHGDALRRTGFIGHDASIAKIGMICFSRRARHKG